MNAHMPHHGPAPRFRPMNPNIMKPKQTPWQRILPLLVPCLVLLGTCLGTGRARAQATPNAPDRLTYQGFLVDANGSALGTTAPKNYDVVFSIYDDPNGGALLWAEQQTVTVDKGNFSVILGEGIEVSPSPRPLLSSIFKGATVSERYIALTVKGIGTGGSNADIQPRLRLLTSPYAFLAQQANKLVKSDGTDLLSANSAAVFLDGSVSVRTNGYLELGGGLAKEANAGRIGYSLLTPNTLDVVGAGTHGTNRQVKIWAEGGATFTGPVIASGFLGSNATFTGPVTASEFRGSGAGLTGIIRPMPGGHLVLAGAGGVPPGTSGWGSALILSGAPAGDNGDPIWMSRFNAGPDSSQLRISIGDNPWSSEDRLVIGTMSGDDGNFNQAAAWRESFTFLANGMLEARGPQARFRMYDDPLGGRSRFGEIAYFYSQDSKIDEIRVALTPIVLPLGGILARQVTFNGNQWQFTSDRRFKQSIADAEPVLAKVLDVRVRRFQWLGSTSNATPSIGVIAQELQPIFPGMVSEVQDREPQSKHLTVAYGDFGVIAIKAIQELKAGHDAEVKQLRAELAELRSQLKEVLASARQLKEGSGKAGQSASVGR